MRRTRFGSEQLAPALGDVDGVWVEVAGAGDVEEARGTFDVKPGGGILSFGRAVPGCGGGNGSNGGDGGGGGGSECGRVRLSGRLIVRGGDAELSSCTSASASTCPAESPLPPAPLAAAPIVTLHSPLFLQGPCVLEPAGPIGDEDWMDEGVYSCKLRHTHTVAVPGTQDTTGTPDITGVTRLEQEVTVVVRGVVPGQTPCVRLTCASGARLELQGGSVSLQEGALSWARGCGGDGGGGGDGDAGGDFVFEGTLDVTPGVTMCFDATASQTVTCLGGPWPWQRAGL